MQRVHDLLFVNRVSTWLIVLALLTSISLLPGTGVVIGFLFVLAALAGTIRQGGYAEIGLRRPESWPRTLVLGVAIGVIAQVVFSVLIDPLVERMTGAAIDVKNLDGVRGSFQNFLIMLAVGWLIGGFLEEMLFRGYLLTRIRRLLGAGLLPNFLAIIVPAIAFGLAHRYQGIAGMVSTGLLGTLFGALFVWYRQNLWLPILVHGSANVVGITLIFTSADRVLNTLLFG